MVIGPTGGGKTQIFNVLRQALAKVREIQIREVRFNPKSITAAQMYGEVDLMSDEWTTGVFAAIWSKYNNRENPYSSWIVCDAPVDTFWIENLNSKLLLFMSYVVGGGLKGCQALVLLLLFC